MHTLVVGKSGSGKSHLAKQFAKAELKAGRGVLLYDPLGNPFPCTWRTADPDKFLEMVMKSKDCLVVIDEAPTICTNLGAHKKFEWLATQSRHNTAVTDTRTKHLFGHRVIFIAQSVTRMAIVYRQNCSRLFAFNVMPSSAGILAEEFGDDTLLGASKLPQFHFLFSTGFGKDGKPHKATMHKAPA